MNEDALIAMVIETKQRVDYIEANMFTKADQNRMFGLLDTLVKGYNDLRDEMYHHSSLLRGLRDDVDELKVDMVRVKNVLELR